MNTETLRDLVRQQMSVIEAWTSKDFNIKAWLAVPGTMADTKYEAMFGSGHDLVWCAYHYILGVAHSRDLEIPELLEQLKL